MNKFYYLSSCSTCKRIVNELNIPDNIQIIDLKYDPLTHDDLNALYSLTGSYESLFNKRARLIKERGLIARTLEEEDYKDLLLDHYTFVKRPILLLENALFIGNHKQTVANAKSFLTNDHES